MLLKIKYCSLLVLGFIILILLFVSCNRADKNTGGENRQMVSTSETTEQERAQQEFEQIKSEALQTKEQTERALNKEISRAETATFGKCEESDERIVECCWEALRKELAYPGAAQLDGYYQPVRDDYGRVACRLTITAPDKSGIYRTKEYAVVLQSCSALTYRCKDYVFYSDAASDRVVNYLLIANDFDEDPLEGREEEPNYQASLELLQNQEYAAAYKKLEGIKSYRAAESLMKAIEDYQAASMYYDCVCLYENGAYEEAASLLRQLAEKYGQTQGYLKSSRLLELCEERLNEAAQEESTEAEITDSTMNDPETATEAMETETEPVFSEAETMTEPSSTSSPTDPQPTAPTPTNPKPTNPSPTNPQPTAPTPTNPAPTEPAPTAHVHTDACRKWVVDVPYQAAVYESSPIYETDYTYEGWVLLPDESYFYYSFENTAAYEAWCSSVNADISSGWRAEWCYINGVRCMCNFTKSSYSYVAGYEEIMVQPEQEEIGHWEYICGY